MKNWTIAKRLAIAQTLVTLGIMVLVFVSWIKTEQISGSVAGIINQSTPELALAGDIRFGATLLRVSNFKYVLYADPAKREGLEKDAGTQEHQLAEWLQAYDKYAKTPEQRALHAKAGPLLESFINETRKLRDASRQNKAEDVQKYLTSVGEVGNDFLKAVEDLRGISSSNVEKAGHKVVQIISVSEWTVLILGILSVLVGVVVGMLTTRGISGILRRESDKLAAGAEQTTAASGQVSAASQVLAEGASEQAASLEETSSSLEEIASMTKRNADNAQTADMIKFGPKTQFTADTDYCGRLLHQARASRPQWQMEVGRHLGRYRCRNGGDVALYQHARRREENGDGYGSGDQVRRLASVQVSDHRSGRQDGGMQGRHPSRRRPDPEHELLRQRHRRQNSGKVIVGL